MYSGAIMPLALVSPRSATLTVVQAGAVLLLAVSLAGCGSSGSRGSSVAQRGSYKVGAPYKIDGVTYTPQEEFNHVETGVASWYGPGFHGKSTANGEPYDQSARTAAHRTLQMPAIVRVTNLDNGMSTVVRINDRGPFARSRIIDLSRTAAQELDIVRNGTGHVRIEQLQAESLAVKDVAMAGGGPAEQQAAVAQVSSGRYAPAAAPAPVQTAAYNPPPAAYAQPAPAPRVRTPACAHPAGMADQSTKPCRRSGAGLRSGQRWRADRGVSRQRQHAAADQRFLCADRRLHDAGERRTPARRREQLRCHGSFSSLGRRTRRLSRAPGTLHNSRCRRHCRRPAETLRVW